MRKAFNFYNSYHATFDDLDDCQIGQLVRELSKVQFLEKHIDEVSFKDKMVSLVWKSIRHSVWEQIRGHCSKRSIDYESVFPTPTQGVDTTTPTPSRQVEVEVEVQVEVQVEESTQQGVVVEVSPTLVSARNVSDYLLNKILHSKPNFRKPNMQTWSQDLEKAIRIDKRTEQELIGCIDWIYTDGSFWIPNILSAKKLREKFDTMESQMTSRNKKKSTVVDSLYDNGLTAQEMIKQMEKRA